VECIRLEWCIPRSERRGPRPRIYCEFPSVNSVKPASDNQTTQSVNDGQRDANADQHAERRHACTFAHDQTQNVATSRIAVFCFFLWDYSLPLLWLLLLSTSMEWFSRDRFCRARHLPRSSPWLVGNPWCIRFAPASPSQPPISCAKVENLTGHPCVQELLPLRKNLHTSRFTLLQPPLPATTLCS
jgi:hypothetical protein